MTKQPTIDNLVNFNNLPEEKHKFINDFKDFIYPLATYILALKDEVLRRKRINVSDNIIKIQKNNSII
jgi:hypothetical protein